VNSRRAVDVTRKPAPSACPVCGKPMGTHVLASTPPRGPSIKRYTLESLFGIKRMNGGFV